MHIDGGNYAGWQIQQNAIGVQQVINEGLSTIVNKPLITQGASRTDTGVHAIQTYAQFDLDEELPDNFIKRINSVLPKDISINNIVKVEDDSHVRFDAIERTYEYILFFKKNPFLQGRGYFYTYDDLDFEQMNKAAKLLLKHTDYLHFAKHTHR